MGGGRGRHVHKLPASNSHSPSPLLLKTPSVTRPTSALSATSPATHHVTKTCGGAEMKVE